MATKPISAEELAAANEKQMSKPLNSEAHGIKVGYNEGKFQITMPFSQTFIKIVKGETKAEWNKEAKCWEAPVSKYDQVSGAVEKLRGLAQAMPLSSVQINEAVQAQVPNSKISKASTSDLTAKDGKVHKALTVGTIVAANEHYVAMTNNNDAPGVRAQGVNYITVHERAALEPSKEVKAEEFAVGRALSVRYYNGQGLTSNITKDYAAKAGPSDSQAPKAAPSKSRGKEKSQGAAASI